LACAARVSPQCASNHLAKLTEGGLLAVETEGRHRYYRLATPQVAAAIEALACIAPAIRSLENPRTSRARSLRFARSCYDHLAGRLGVAVLAEAEARVYLVASSQASKRYVITAVGKHWLETIGVDIDTLKPGTAGVARRCLDWTERRYHLAGPLGAVLLFRFTEFGWLRRDPATRAVTVTPLGATEFARLLNINVVGLQQADHENHPDPIGTRSQSTA
jgi:DNA-binding transcriptional ArsR family regulator